MCGYNSVGKIGAAVCTLLQVQAVHASMLNQCGWSTTRGLLCFSLRLEETKSAGAGSQSLGLGQRGREFGGCLEATGRDGTDSWKPLLDWVGSVTGCEASVSYWDRLVGASMFEVLLQFRGNGEECVISLEAREDFWDEHCCPVLASCWGFLWPIG